MTTVVAIHPYFQLTVEVLKRAYKGKILYLEDNSQYFSEMHTVCLSFAYCSMSEFLSLIVQALQNIIKIT